MLREFLNLKERSLFATLHHTSVTLLRRLRSGISYVNEHELYHNFQDNPSPMCDCGSVAVESLPSSLQS